VQQWEEDDDISVLARGLSFQSPRQTALCCRSAMQVAPDKRVGFPDCVLKPLTSRPFWDF